MNISWPVFKLTNTTPLQDDNISYYITESYNKDTATYKKNIRIIDDKNLAEPIFSRRRLQLKAAGVPLYPINKAIYFLADLIKLASINMWFIDSEGVLFQYKKSTRAKLNFYKIENIWPLDNMGAVIEVQGLSQRFKVLFKPTQAMTYAGVLEWQKNKVLYGLYENCHGSTWRLV